MAAPLTPPPQPPAATEPLLPPSVRAREAVQCISSEALLGGAQEVLIEHRGALYRLRQTSLGKLILTK